MGFARTTGFIGKHFKKRHPGPVRPFAGEKGQTMIEYALVVVLIVILLVLAFGTSKFKTTADDATSKISSAFNK